MTEKLQSHFFTVTETLNSDKYIGNGSVPKIIINDTIKFFRKFQSAFW